MLLKFALIIGVDFTENITFEEICPRNLIPFNICGDSNQVGAESTSFLPVTGSSATDSKIIAKEKMQPGCEMKREELCASSNDPLTVSGLERKRTDTNPSKPDDDDYDPIPTKEGRNEVDENVCFDDKKKSKNLLPVSHHQCRYSVEEVNTHHASSTEENFDPPHRKKPASAVESAGRVSADESSDETSSSSENDIKETRSESLFKGTDEEGIKIRECEKGNGESNHNEIHSCFCCCHLHLKNDSHHWKSSDNYVGALAHFSINSKNPATASPYVDYDKILSKLHSFEFDVVLGADGRRNTLSDNFPRKEFRGRLAIAITANFVNTHTLTEAQIPEISGISFIYNQQLFR